MNMQQDRTFFTGGPGTRVPGLALVGALVGALALGLAGEAAAWGDCDHERKLERTLDVAGSERLVIDAAAGDLELRGREGSDMVTVSATICASKAGWSEAADLVMEPGREARVATVMPDPDGFGWGDRYVIMDLVISVPGDLAVDINDSSGDIDVAGVAALVLKDSSGDIEVASSGGVSIEDSSGDIELDGIDGDVIIVRDSSGDIRGSDIRGGVVVARDSSGGIRFRDVRDDFIVERDSSGDIVAEGIGGNFTVLSDGSGDVSHRDVRGSVSVPADD